MAITITAGAWTPSSGGAGPEVVLPASPQANDLHILYAGGKPFGTTINDITGWTRITNVAGTNGTTASGTDVGSIAQEAWYRFWQSGDGNPTVSLTGANVFLCCIHRFRPTAGKTLITPVGEKGTDVSSGTGYAATMGSDIGITAGDAVVSYTTIAGNNSTFGTQTLSATGVTFGTVSESPATEGSTSSGNDLEASASTALPSAGPSSAAAVVGWTLSVAQTGMSALVRIREASAGTQYNQSVDGAMTPSGALIRDGRKTLSGANTPGGTVTKLTSKIFAGALSSIVGTLTKQTNKDLTGGMTSSGIVTGVRIILKDVSGAISSIVGTLVNQAQKPLSGTNTPTGAITKQTNKTLSGDITSIIGTLIKRASKLFSGALSDITGALTAIKIALLSISGGVTPTGALTNQANKTLAGDMTSAGALTRLTQKVLIGALSPIGAITRLISLFKTGDLTPTGTTNKQTSKGLNGIIASIVGALTSVFQSGSVSTPGAFDKVYTPDKFKTFEPDDFATQMPAKFKSYKADEFETQTPDKFKSRKA